MIPFLDKQRIWNVVKQPECYVKFKDAWLSKWNPAILKIAKAGKIKIIDEDDTQGMHVDELPEGNILFDIYIA